MASISQYPSCKLVRRVFFAAWWLLRLCTTLCRQPHDENTLNTFLVLGSHGRSTQPTNSPLSRQWERASVPVSDLPKRSRISDFTKPQNEASEGCRYLSSERFFANLQCEKPCLAFKLGWWVVGRSENSVLSLIQSYSNIDAINWGLTCKYRRSRYVLEKMDS